MVLRSPWIVHTFQHRFALNYSEHLFKELIGMVEILRLGQKEWLQVNRYQHLSHYILQNCGFLEPYIHMFQEVFCIIHVHRFKFYEQVQNQWSWFFLLYQKLYSLILYRNEQLYVYACVQFHSVIIWNNIYQFLR